MTEPLMTAEELRSALAAAGVPVAATIEPRGGAMKLARYWTKGEGAAKIRWGTDGDFNRCVLHLGKFVKDPKGLCNEYHQLALGAPPGKGHAAAAAAGDDGVMRGVELARTGVWDLSTGKTEFTRAKFADAVEFYEASGRVPFPVKLGHLKLPDGFEEWDGLPAFGLVENPRINPGDPDSLLGDLIEMPQWLHAAAPRSWPSRSIEAFENVDYKGRTYSMVLTGLALLGVTPPGVRDVKSLRDLQVAVAAAAGSRFIAATAPEAELPQPPTVGEAKTAIDERVDRFITERLDEPPTPQTLPDPGTESSPLLDTNPPTQEGAGMDPAKLREAVGLKPDASDDEVTAALASAGFKVAASAPPTPPPDPATPPNPAPNPEPVPAQPAPNGGKPTPGTVVIDSSQLEEIRATATRMRVLEERIQRGDRDELITSAIKAGKFPQARRQHWETAYNADPEGTKAVIASMAANLVPIAASGYAGDPDAEFDADYSTLYPPEVKVRG